jgi:alanine racemase
MVVVKADAYGHGATEVAAAALHSGATWLGVYTVSEGVILRRAGIAAPIMVFGSYSGAEAREIVHHGLIPTIGSLEAAVALCAAAPPEPVQFHIKIDTGLSRSGVHPSESAALLHGLSAFSDLRLQGVFTHFARADEPSHPETLHQFSRFMLAVETLREEGFTIPMLHVANSGATLEYPEMHLDMVRCGITTYGYYPSRESPRVVRLTPGLSLVSRTVRVHTLPAGAGVGYGHEFRCSRETLLALVPIGYGDGLPRSLGGGRGHVLVRGH